MKQLQKYFAGLLAFLFLLIVNLPIANAEDSDLTQTVSADEVNDTSESVVDIGHVDLGPRVVDGQWKALARDDSGETPVWRTLEKTVLSVTDAALLNAPESADFDFMGEDRIGEKWWVVPQTENPNALWLGWNTQDPAVTEMVDRGVTMRLGPVQGPGKTWLFLQNGTFGEPLVLLDGQKQEPQDVWVDVNTHVHANWVFTKPGVYLVPVQFLAKTRDGGEVKSVDVIRFAVGDDTDPAAVLKEDTAAVLKALEESSTQTNSDSGNEDATSENSELTSQAGTETSGTTSQLSIFVIAAVVISLTVVLAVLLMIRRHRAIAKEQKLAKEQFREQIKH